MSAGEKRFAPLLNEKEVIELLENATPGSIEKATKYGMKIFQGKNLKTLFWQFKHFICWYLSTSEYCLLERTRSPYWSKKDQDKHLLWHQK